MTGLIMKTHIENSFKKIDKMISDTKTTITNKMKTHQDNVTDLLVIKNKINEVENQTEDVNLSLDVLEECLNYFQKTGTDKKKELATKQKLTESMQKLAKELKETKKEIAPVVMDRSAKTQAEIKIFEEDLKKFHAELQKEPFY